MNKAFQKRFSNYQIINDGKCGTTAGYGYDGKRYKNAREAFEDGLKDFNRELELYPPRINKRIGRTISTVNKSKEKSVIRNPFKEIIKKIAQEYNNQKGCTYLKEYMKNIPHTEIEIFKDIFKSKTNASITMYHGKYMILLKNGEHYLKYIN